MTRPEADVLIDNPTALPSARHAAWLIVLSVVHKRLQQPTGCIACDKIKMEAASHSVDHPGSVLTQCPPVKNVKQWNEVLQCRALMSLICNHPHTNFFTQTRKLCPGTKKPEVQHCCENASSSWRGLSTLRQVVRRKEHRWIRFLGQHHNFFLQLNNRLLHPSDGTKLLL